MLDAIIGESSRIGVAFFGPFEGIVIGDLVALSAPGNASEAFADQFENV